MYTTDHIFLVISIKHLVNQNGGTTTPHKLVTGMKPSVSNPRVLFCSCVVQNLTAHVDTKELNMSHQLQKCLRGIFVGILQHQKGYLIYVPSTRKIASSHDVVLDKTFSGVLTYTPCLYSEALAMRPSV